MKRTERTLGGLGSIEQRYRQRGGGGYITFHKSVRTLLTPFAVWKRWAREHSHRELGGKNFYGTLTRTFIYISVCCSVRIDTDIFVTLVQVAPKSYRARANIREQVACYSVNSQSYKNNYGTENPEKNVDPSDKSNKNRFIVLAVTLYIFQVFLRDWGNGDSLISDILGSAMLTNCQEHGEGKKICAMTSMSEKLAHISWDFFFSVKQSAIVSGWSEMLYKTNKRFIYIHTGFHFFFC